MPTPELHNQDRLLSYQMTNDFALFVQFFAAQTIPNFVFEPYMQYLCEQFEMHAQGVFACQDLIKLELESGKKIYDIDSITEKVGIAKTFIVNVAPGHTKSTIMSVMSIAWLYAKNPSLAIALVSNGSALSQKNGRLAKAVIDHEAYRRLFPYVKFDSDNSGHKILSKVDGFARQGELFMGGVNSAITGNHFDFILLDDPNKASDNYSAADRRAVTNYIGTVVSSRVRDGACVFLIQQRICKDDATDYLLRVRSSHKHVKLPDTLNADTFPLPLGLKALYSENKYGEVVLSQRVPSQRRADAKSDGSYLSQFQQQPSSAQQDLFLYNFKQDIHFVECAYNPRMPIYLGVDFNNSNNTAVVCQTDLQGFIFVLDEIETVSGGVPAMCVNINRYFKDNNIDINTVFICPDKTGAAVRSESNTSNIAALQEGLRLNARNILHGNYNPNYIKFNLPLQTSSRLLNKAFAHKTMDIRINPKCEKLKWDFDNIVTIPDADGGITTNKDHIAGSPYNANALDSFSYFMQSVFFTNAVKGNMRNYVQALDIALK